MSSMRTTPALAYTASFTGNVDHSSMRPAVKLGVTAAQYNLGVPEPHHMSFIDFSWNRTRTKEHQSEEVFFDVKLLNMLRQGSPRFVVWPWSC